MLACLIVLSAVLAAASPSSASEAVFSAYGPLSRSSDVLQRLISPLNAWRIEQQALVPGRALREQSVDLARERFDLYAPASMPTNGYALLVFLSPSAKAALPSDWKPVLDRLGMIYVAAENAGNDADVLDRREPLALLAAYNVMQRYRVDPQRIYVGGFSGGSHVALRLALGYPDLFRGALLIAGSEAIGNARIPLPPAPLFDRFRRTSRLVYLTGQNDPARLAMDARSVDAMRQWCVAGTVNETLPWAGHELPSGAALDRALRRLEQPVGMDTPALAACRARIDAQLQEAQHKLAAALDAGQRTQASALLEAIDATYGGLASPGIEPAIRRLEPGAAPSR